MQIGRQSSNRLLRAKKPRPLGAGAEGGTLAEPRRALRSGVRTKQHLVELIRILARFYLIRLNPVMTPSPQMQALWQVPARRDRDASGRKFYSGVSIDLCETDGSQTRSEFSLI